MVREADGTWRRPRTPEEAEAYLALLEHDALRPFSGGIGGLVGVRFERCAKRDGGNIQRGKTWGRIVYTRAHRPGGGWVDESIDRDTALREVATDINLIHARFALENVRTCDGCGVDGEGDDNRKHWQRVMLYTPQGLQRGPGVTHIVGSTVVSRTRGSFEPTYRVRWLDLCDTCVRRIADGALRLR